MNVQSYPSSSDGLERLRKYTLADKAGRGEVQKAPCIANTGLDTVTVPVQIDAPSHQILLKFNYSEFL